jgi:hypothetical protein
MSDDSADSDVKLARIEVLLGTLTRQVGELATLLLGKDGNPGVVVRLDRIEQSHARLMKFAFLLAGGAGTALGKAYSLL